MKNVIKHKTVKQLLLQADIDALDAEVLLAHVLAKPREFVVSHPEYIADVIQRIRFFNMVRMRKKGYAVARIIRTKEFFGFDFTVNKHTLIPRPDTEILVEAALKEAADILIDVGTGTGCIPISMLKNIKNSYKKVFAIDISKHALRVAKKNAQKHNVDITFFKGNLLQPILHENLQNKKIIITANLPYLTEKQFQDEQSIQREPKNALVANDNGLELYKKLIDQIKTLTATEITCFFEIDPSQSKALSAYIKKILSNTSIEIKKDLAGQDRILSFKI